MFIFPDTSILLTRLEKKALDNIKPEGTNICDEMINNLYNKGYLKKFGNKYFNPDKTIQISYLIELNKKDFFMKINYYVDKENNQYYFKENGLLKEKITKEGQIKYLYKKNGELAEIITNKSQYIYRHTDKYTEVYDKNNPIETRKVIDSMKNTRYDINYFNDLSPYTEIKNKYVKYIINILCKQGLTEEETKKIIMLNYDKKIVVTIPEYANVEFLNYITKLNMSIQRITAVTNEYKCRNCEQYIEYYKYLDKIICPNCHYENILTN